MTLPDGSGNPDDGGLPGSDVAPPDGDSPDADAGSQLTDAGPQLDCPMPESGRSSALPSGACSGAGSCAVELDNSCQPGVAYTSSQAPVFACNCSSGQWQCDLISGGMGLIPCGDAGSP